MENLKNKTDIKVLISDYDFTFYTGEEEIKENVKKTEEFKRTGNIFVIATARDPKSIREKLEKYNIQCDYVISYLGGVIEKDEEYIYVCYLKENVVNRIDKIISKYDNLEIIPMSIKESPKVDEIIGYKIICENQETLYNIAEEFKDDEYVWCRVIENELYINNKVHTKVTAINELIEKCDFSKEQIYTVGDFDDDLEMLLNFNGYRMKNSSELLKENIKNEVSSVGELIEIINK